MDEWDFEILASQLPCRLTGGRYLIKLFGLHWAAMGQNLVSPLEQKTLL